jgi:hypothetical protein
LVTNIGEPIYRTTKLEMIINIMDFSRDPPKSWNSTKRHLFNKVIVNFDSIINSNLELTRKKSSVEYPIEDSTLESAKVNFKLFYLELARIDFGMEST